MRNFNGLKFTFEKGLEKLYSKIIFSFFLIFMIVFQLSANTINSEKKIRFQYNNTSLINIFNEIKTQTDYTFFYNNKSIDDSKKISLIVKDETIVEVLRKISDKVKIDYKINGNQIVLTKRISSNIAVQEFEIKGVVLDQFGTPLPGANVVVKGTTKGTQTDFDGNFVLNVDDDKAILLVSYIGFETVEIVVGNKTNITVTLKEAVASLDEIVMVGSRSKPRTQLESVVPIDVIGKAVLENTPRAETSQILQFAAPSFHSTKQNIGHGTDHVDPIALRGLGSDQTLVLINGKRRHASSLMNVNGTVGRGQVGTDLNAIPSAAIERIEVLRDGAAAQYGSDAIAGVPGFLEEFNPYSDNPNLASEQGSGGGETYQFSTNFGVGIGDKGGFINFTLNYLTKRPFNRTDDYTIELFDEDDPRRDNAVAEFAAFNQGDAQAIAAYNAEFGDQFGFAIVNDLNDFTGRRLANVGGSGSTNAGIVINTEIPVNDKSTFYANAMYNYRLGTATGFPRRPNQPARQSGLWPLGFSPHLDSDIQDLSGTLGLRSNFNGWDVDISNDYGQNSFKWTIYNSNNASLGLESPTTFDAGQLMYAQNVINFDVAKSHDVGFNLNTAFGSEFRLENFQQIEGEEASYQNFDGGVSEAGSQVFPGYQPINATNKFRFNSAVYADLEAEFTENWLFTTAGIYNS